MDKRVTASEDKMRNDMAELIEQNINPQFDELRDQLRIVENQVKQTKNTMVTKSYLDNRLEDFESGMLNKVRKEDKKVNALTQILHDKQVLNSDDLNLLSDYQIFPKLPTV